MAVDPTGAARAAISKADPNAAEITVTANVARWTGSEIRKFIDEAITASGPTRLKIAGIRTTPTIFMTMGAQGDSARGGKLGEIPVAIAEIDFDTLEIVFKRGKAG